MGVNGGKCIGWLARLPAQCPAEERQSYINCNAKLGLWFAVARSVAEACYKICWRIYSLETSAISASLSVELLDTRFSY